jgi:hypothetical protein
MLKFLYITNDPFVNNSEEFVRILAISAFPGPNINPSGGFGQQIGALYDPNGNLVSVFGNFSMVGTTNSTAYPETVSYGYQMPQIFLVPPGWTFKTFIRAIAVQGTLEEVLRVH